MYGMRVTIKAHFDGQHVVLDEPCNLLPNTPVIVTVLSVGSEDRADWRNVSQRTLARAYSDSEPEYSAADVRPE